jgi:hypothetical protein
MADEQDKVVLVAIARAASQYTPLEWFALPSNHRTRAIYRELRLLDAATSGRPQGMVKLRRSEHGRCGR